MNKKESTASQKTVRGLIYALGIILLSCGIMSSTKASFGAPPVITAAHAVTLATGVPIGITSFVQYALCALIEYIILGKSFRKMDLLQLPFSVLMSSLLTVFAAMLPNPATIAGRAALLIAGIILIGVGVTFMVNMNLVPNPADGLVKVIADKSGKPMGLVKNIFDLACVAAGAITSFALTGGFKAIGVGTLLTMIFIGRVVAVVNHFFKDRMLRAAGLA